MSDFEKFVKQQKGRKGGLAAVPLDEIKEEIITRDSSDNIFPLDVFNVKIRPYINVLHEKYDIPRSYIGLALLTTYSAAIGTSYVVSPNGQDTICLAIWACNAGISSSGKTYAFKKVMQPLFDIQKKFNAEWKEATENLSDEKRGRHKMKVIIDQDTAVPTVARAILPDNLKGITKFYDELIGWVNSMNQMGKKEGSDEQFWLSTWNCTPYYGTRSGKDRFTLERPFLDVFGGIQYKIMHKLFANDRDHTGFIFRMLFAVPEADRVCQPDISFTMPDEWYGIHEKSIQILYNDLEVEFDDEPQKKCVLSSECNKIFMDWRKATVNQINEMEDLDDKDTHAQVFGKISEYTLRFAAILFLSDKSLDDNYEPDYFNGFKDEEHISSEYMFNAIRLGEYFYKSAVDIYGRVKTTTIAPLEVIVAAALLKKGKPAREIASIVWGDDTEAAKKRMQRQLKRWIIQYRKVFNA